LLGESSVMVRVVLFDRQTLFVLKIVKIGRGVILIVAVDVLSYAPPPQLAVAK